MERAESGEAIADASQSHVFGDNDSDIHLGFEMIFELHPAGLNTIIPPGGKWMRVRYWHRVTEEEVYPTIGEDGFRRLVAAFYRQVPGDSILGPMYPADDLEGAEYRLRMFLIGRFGGPPTYIEERGHPRLRMRHLPFLINQVARDRWMALMAKALDEAQLPPEADAVLRHFFEGMSSFMMNS